VAARKQRRVGERAEVEAALRALDAACLRRPSTLTLVLTEGCNLACGHCWVESPFFSSVPPVPAGDLCRAAEEFAELGGTTLNLTGGEALTHPEWARVLRFAADLAALQTICFQTNAALLSAADAEVLAEVARARARRPEQPGGCGLWVQVSLDGARPETHDLIRGSGAFAATVAGLRLLVAAGVRTRIAFTEMRHNLDDLPALFALVEELGVDEVISASLVRHGRALTSTCLEPPTGVQYADLLDRYHSDPVFSHRVDERGTVVALSWLAGREHPREETCIFADHLYLSTRGLLFPCHLFPIEQFAARNVYERSLAQAILEAAPLWAEAQALSCSRVPQIVACAECPGQAHCAGGCMGRAWLTHGGPEEPEDRCELRRAVYAWQPPGAP
jgi:radical SAM protein with 4Fe4S-binding SPASM domain